MIDGATYFPPEVLNRSFLRSVILTKPRSSTAPMSPVWNQPSSVSTSAVASGRLWYPRMTPGPLTRISPSSAIRTWVPGSGQPTVPKM